MTEITDASVLETIFDGRNKRRKIWTATILIDRMGIARSPIPYSDYDVQARRRANKVLHELWQQGRLLRKIKPDTRNRYLAGAEVAYLRPADATGPFLIPCRACRQPCLSRGEQSVVCATCQNP